MIVDDLMTMTTSKALNVPYYTFKNLAYLATALTHPSYKNENKSWPHHHHENFEFVGDAFLNNIVALKLFELYPTLSEGELSKLRSSVVNEEVLASVAQFIKLDEIIFVGNSEVKLTSVDSVKANTFEAVIAAIFFDSDFETTKHWLETVFNAYSPDFFSINSLTTYDPKSQLQEYTMKTFKVLPVYTAVEKKQNKETFFEVTLSLNDKVLGTVIEASKKKAEKILANTILNKLNNGESLC